MKNVSCIIAAYIVTLKHVIILVMKTKKTLLGIIILFTVLIAGILIWPESKIITPEEDEKVLFLTTVTHLDRHDEPIYEYNESRYLDTTQIFRELADLYEEHGAQLTLEASTDFAKADEKFGEHLLSELVERGHGVGAHVDYGIDGQLSRTEGHPVSNVTYDELVELLIEQKEIMESLTGQPLVHSSGTPSTLDWVSANAEAGFECHSSIVTYYLVSLDEEHRPSGWTDEYILDGNYHQPFPFVLKDRLNPWTMDDGTNWTKDNPDGQLVAIPGESGTHLGFFSEYYDQGITKHAELLKIGEFNEDDIAAVEKMILEALEKTKTDQINTQYFMLSMTDIRTDYENGFPLLSGFLTWVDGLVEDGKVEWASIPEMCTSYIE